MYDEKRHTLKSCVCAAGKWGIFVNAVNTVWQKGDAFTIVNLAKPDLKIKVSWMSMMSEGSSFGVRKNFTWLENRSLLLHEGSVFGARLVKEIAK